MPFLLSLLQGRSFVIWAALAIAVTAVWFYIYTLRAKVDKLTADLTLSRTQTAVVESSNRSLKSAIEEQNTLVEQLRAADKQRNDAYAAEIAKAKQNTAKANKRADDIMNSKPPQGVPLCDAANQLFNQEIGAK